MEPQKEKQNISIHEGISENTVHSDLNDIYLPGLMYWRGVPIYKFTKDQLVKIIYLLMEND